MASPSDRGATLRGTAALARVLWYGSIVAGGIAGGIGAVLLTYRLIFKETPC